MSLCLCPQVKISTGCSYMNQSRNFQRDWHPSLLILSHMHTIQTGGGAVFSLVKNYKWCLQQLLHVYFFTAPWAAGLILCSYWMLLTNVSLNYFWNTVSLLLLVSIRATVLSTLFGVYTQNLAYIPSKWTFLEKWLWSSIFAVSLFSFSLSLSLSLSHHSKYHNTTSDCWRARCSAD